MPSSRLLVQPMRDEVTRLGVEELLTPAAVDAFLRSNQGPALVFINSVCGCAAGNARPGLSLAIKDPRCPSCRVTVFAGQDPEATARLREFFPAIAPSSPCFLVLEGRRVVGHVPRAGIEGHSALQVRDAIVHHFASFDDTASA